MDWPVTARTGKPHTKLFHAERGRETFVVVDLRAPMHFGTRSAFKAVVAAHCAALAGNVDTFKLLVRPEQQYFKSLTVPTTYAIEMQVEKGGLGGILSAYTAAGGRTQRSSSRVSVSVSASGFNVSTTSAGQGI